MRHVFEIPGEAVGYYASGSHPNWKRMNAYHAYKKVAQLYAVKAGLRLPMVASEVRSLFVGVLCVFKDRRHPDPANVQKGICDALFYTKHEKGAGDKHTGALAMPPIYGDTPRVVVFVSDEDSILSMLVTLFKAR